MYNILLRIVRCETIIHLYALLVKSFCKNNSDFGIIFYKSTRAPNVCTFRFPTIEKNIYALPQINFDINHGFSRFGWTELSTRFSIRLTLLHRKVTLKYIFQKIINYAFPAHPNTIIFFFTCSYIYSTFRLRISR